MGSNSKQKLLIRLACVLSGQRSSANQEHIRYAEEVYMKTPEYASARALSGKRAKPSRKTSKVSKVSLIDESRRVVSEGNRTHSGG